MDSIYEYKLKELEDKLVTLGEKKYRAKQLYDWLYIKQENNFDNMTNLNKTTISNFKEKFLIDDITITKKLVDKDTSKYLFNLSDNEKIETVLMKQTYGNSLCISTQVGCNMNCSFCESGRLLKKRNLTCSELILQVLKVEKDISSKISHIVVMGIGEPFDNYDNLCKFIEIINNPFGLNIGARHITISTCGLIPKIKEFMLFPYQVNLAISLHASNNELRNKLMPINKIYPLEELLDVVKEYIKKTNRRVTFEYILLKDINDQENNAKELAKLIRGINCYVNLIPYNETSHLTYKRSNQLSKMLFYDILKKEKINVTIRKEFGTKLKAACGQLRANEE